MSLKFCALASGSKGNCCYVSDGRTDILIDLGISATRVEKCLSVLNVDPNGVNILITHSHTDHIGGVKMFCKKHCGARLFCQKESARSIARATDVAPQKSPRSFALGELMVTAVPVSHDVPCFGYVISDGENKVAVVTDIGKVELDQLELLAGCDIVMLEANHDEQKLAANPRYTAELKARIASSSGHLSNADCGAACAYLACRGVKNFVLAHLSEENNDPLLAIDSIKSCLTDSGITDARIVAARQDGMSGLFEVC